MELQKAIAGVLRKPEFGEPFEVMTTTDILQKVQEYSREYFNSNELGRALKQLGFKRINFREGNIHKKGYRVYLFNVVVNQDKKPTITTREAVRLTFRDPMNGEPGKWIDLPSIAGVLTKKYKNQFDRTEIKKELKAIKVRQYAKPVGDKRVLVFSVVHLPDVETT